MNDRITILDTLLDLLDVFLLNNLRGAPIGDLDKVLIPIELNENRMILSHDIKGHDIVRFRKATPVKSGLFLDREFLF